MVRRLVTAFLLVALIAAPDAPAFAQATPAAGEATTIADPSGRYSLPVPIHWRGEVAAGYLRLVDPDGEIEVLATEVDAADTAQGVLDAWAMVDPGYPSDTVPLDSSVIPSRPGVDETLVVTYERGDQSGNVVQAVGQRIGRHVYVAIFRGSVEAFVKRDSQVQVIFTGFTFAELARAHALTDLSAVRPVPLAGEKRAAWEAYIEDLMSRLDVPGASVAVVQDGRIVYQAGFGVTELGGDRRVGPDTMMMIGSVTKSMTTLMMASEVDDGVFGWDTPVQTIYPGFAVADPGLSRTITMRNMVCACTGVPRRDLEFLFNANELDASDVVASLRDFAFSTGFGEAFQYSNQMVASGGYIAASAAGGSGTLEERYRAEMEQRVFTPIGMSRTTFDIAAVERDPDHATPHGSTLAGAYEPIALALEGTLEPIAPAGAAWSTAADMARSLQTELARGVAPSGTRVVSEANLDQTWRPQVQVDADTGYGLGWFVGSFNGARLIDHGGNTLGFTSDLAFLPDHGLGVVVLANAQGANLFAEGVRTRLLELLFDQPETNDATIAYAERQAAASVATVTAALDAVVDPAMAASAVGTYENPVLGKIELRMDGPDLIVDAGEFQTRLTTATSPSSGETAFVAVDPPVAGASLVPRGDGLLLGDVSGESYAFSPVEDATPVASP